MRSIKNFLEKLKSNNLLLDGLNVGLGAVLIIALIVFAVSQAWLALLAVVWAAGLMNMVNGLKTMRKKGRNALGQSMLMFGLIILVGGTFLILSAMGV